MIITKCGYRCDLCLAYKENIEKEDKRHILSDLWHQYYGFRIEPENILCEGCVSCEDPKLIDSSCPVRPCVINKQLENCAHCESFICEKLQSRIVDYDEKINFNHENVSELDYEYIVKPYESKKILMKIRDQIKNAK